MPKVSIESSNISFFASPGETILAAAHRQNIELPWGCGEGVCGVCLCRVVSGEVVYPNGDPMALFDSDKEAGLVLICSATPVGDVVLNNPELQ